MGTSASIKRALDGLGIGSHYLVNSDERESRLVQADSLVDLFLAHALMPHLDAVVNRPGFDGGSSAGIAPRICRPICRPNTW